MRCATLLLTLSACALYGANAAANAQDYGFDNRAVVYDRSIIDARVEMQPIDAVATGQSARRIFEHAFFTPVANYQQAGYQCGGMVSVSFSGGKRHLHRGTYCVR